MTIGLLVPLLVTIITAATPLLLAALGELVVERAGVLNLGVEGMMLVGAVCAFAAETMTGSSTIGIVAGAAAGAAMAGLFGVLTLTLTSNQVATGLALTIFGTGLSTLIGHSYTGRPIKPFTTIFPEALANDPIGRVFFSYSPLV